MNVKHIFVCTICIVLPSSMYSNVHQEVHQDDYDNTDDLDDEEDDLNCTTHDLSQHVKLYTTFDPRLWNLNETLSPVRTDDKGNVLLKVNTWYKQSRTHAFVQSDMKLGMALEVRFASTLNKELTRYLSQILEIPRKAIKIVDGKSKEKTVQLSNKYITAEDVLEKVTGELKIY